MDGEFPDFGISERDAEVVRTIEDEGLSVFTFDGLRRLTGTHPETLSRALDRLEEVGVVVRTPEGYSVQDSQRGEMMPRHAYGQGEKVAILHTFLPSGAVAGAVIEALKGRWFDRMRWVGTSETEDGIVLKWVVDDGSAIIDAKFAAGQLDIEAKLKENADLGKAVRAAHQLVGRISRMYSGPRQGNRVSFMRVGYFRPYAM